MPGASAHRKDLSESPYIRQTVFEFSVNDDKGARDQLIYLYDACDQEPYDDLLTINFNTLKWIWTGRERQGRKESPS